MTLERPQPPHNSEAEQALLGAILCQNSALEKVVGFLAPEHFHEPVNGRIFDAILKTIDAGRIANPVTLKTHFDQDGALTEIGGAAYLVKLAKSVVTIVNADDYGRTILECWQRRELMRLADELTVDAATISLERPVSGIIEETEHRLYDLGERRASSSKAVDISHALNAALEQSTVAYQAGNGITGIPTGLYDLDRTLGGLQRKNLVVLAGRPSMGKTALAVTIAANATKAGIPVAFFSLEMPKEQIAQRLMAGLTGLSSDKQARGELEQEDFDRLIRASDTIGSWPLVIDDTGSLSTMQIRQRARRIAKRRRGLGLIIVDHLQKMRQGRRSENRRLEIGEITGTLADIAKELDVAVLLLSQLSRALEQREDKRPMLSDLRESGDIEQDADVVMFCYRDEYYLERAEPKQGADEKREKFAEKRSNWLDQMERARGKADIIIAKNRQGPVRALEAAFLGERSRFESLERR